MGRPLKIRKYNGSIVVDQGYPNDGTTDNGFTGNQPGIVGGTHQDSDQIECQVAILVKGLGTISSSTSSTTVTGVGTNFTTDALNSTAGLIWVSNGLGGYTEVGAYSSTTDNTHIVLAANASVTLSGSAWYYTVATNTGSIIRQKGAKKFMVTTQQSIQDESIAKGQSYMIATANDTDWYALGAGINATAGDVFTAIKDGTGLATNGVVYPVGVCTLVNSSSPSAPNTMSIGINNNGTSEYAATVKDHFVTDYSTPYSNCNPGTTFVATFFTNNGTDTASGKDIVAVENWC